MEKIRMGTFICGQQELAIDVRQIDEVVSVPEHLSPIPKSPNFVLGIFSLREELIPVVDISVLLNIPRKKSGAESKFVIITKDAKKMALAFDGIGEIISQSTESLSHIDSKEKSQLFIDRAVTFEDGKRVVEVLNLDSIFLVHNIPYLKMDPETASRKKARNIRRQAATFMIGREVFGIEISDLQEISLLVNLKAAVLVSENCVGYMNQRGENIPIIDFARVLSINNSDAKNLIAKQVLIVKLEAFKVGLMVDQVLGLEFYYESELLKIDNMIGANVGMFQGLVSRDGGEKFFLLDWKCFQKMDELLKICEGYANIFSSQFKSKSTNSIEVRRTYLTFRMFTEMAIPIDKIHEIISVPKDMQRPPGFPEEFLGVLNLRGELIKIVDTPRVYNQKMLTTEFSKLIILNFNDKKYGILVEDIVSILNINEKNKISLPSLISNFDNKELNNDLYEFVEVVDFNGKDKHTLCIMDFTTLFQRLESRPRTLAQSRLNVA